MGPLLPSGQLVTGPQAKREQKLGTGLREPACRYMEEAFLKTVFSATVELYPRLKGNI